MKDEISLIPLVILDVQDAIDRPNWDGKNNPGYLAVIQRLLGLWRSNGWPVLHVKHDEQAPASSYYVHGPWNGIKKEVAPIQGEPVITKQENCAFIGTELDAVLTRMRVKRLVLTGVVVHNSIDATVRAGKALGYRIILPSDATTAVPVVGAHGECWDATTVQALTLAILGDEYADVMSSDELLAQLSLTPVAITRA
ncbi:isochorismatase family protein [Pseudomonas sp. HY13-MNA-CIBAN-0226]|uniref:isochorismatase family protein n=1 Tax=Pseudomonas sp. HY13-MNA-CIBAN-0226 TaxID=3140473 RepID=UPI00332BB8ED